MPRPKKMRTATGPFRGGTPKNVIQTVDAGSGFSPWLLGQARKHGAGSRPRSYAAVDPRYAENGKMTRRMLAFKKNLETAGVRVEPLRLEEFIEKMKEEGLRTRHVNIELPASGGLGFGGVGGEKLTVDSLNLQKLFAEVQKILLPNGKIYITSESDRFLSAAEKLAGRYGLKTRRLKGLSPEAQRTEVGILIKSVWPIMRLEITYGLKKAVSGEGREARGKRGEWPRLKET